MVHKVGQHAFHLGNQQFNHNLRVVRKVIYIFPSGLTVGNGFGSLLYGLLCIFKENLKIKISIHYKTNQL